MKAMAFSLHRPEKRPKREGALSNAESGYLSAAENFIPWVAINILFSPP